MGLKDIFGSLISKEKVSQLFYRNNFNVTKTLSHALRIPRSVQFSTRNAFSELEKDLFEVGMREFNKDFRKIRDLIKSKTLEEVYTYYYYWKSTARYDSFYENIKDELFNETQLLARRRARLLLERLIRRGCDP